MVSFLFFFSCIEKNILSQCIYMATNSRDYTLYYSQGVTDY